MTRRARALILDSWAVLAYFEDEPAGKAVSELIVDARDNDIPMMMSVVNAGEVWYIIARKISVEEADMAITALLRIGIEFIEADWPAAKLAGEFKAKNRMSYADCFAAALAASHKAELVTGDREFRQLEGNIRIRWL
jgi:Predicted nucleic acid-binding protein, contains PIN domain